LKNPAFCWGLESSLYATNYHESNSKRLSFLQRELFVNEDFIRKYDIKNVVSSLSQMFLLDFSFSLNAIKINVGDEVKH